LRVTYEQWQDIPMKARIVVIALVAVAACKKEPPAPEIGVKECDEYVVKYEACIGKMAPEAKSQAASGFDAQRAAFKDSATTPEARARLAEQCRAALEAIRPTCGP